MEQYPARLQPALSSNYSFGQTIFPWSKVLVPALDKLHGEDQRRDFMSSKGKEEATSFGSNYGNSDFEDEKRITKKKVQIPKYAFKTRSQVDVLDDGYRWRKYGQKAVKNDRFPRSYYRCTHQGCSVKKQIQRLSNDEGVVVTTYEGKHNHSTEKSNDSFEQILSQMRIFT